jgi:hypothetical protein
MCRGEKVPSHVIKNLDAKKCSKQQCYTKDQQDIKIEKYSTKIDRKPQENETYPLTGNLKL